MSTEVIAPQNHQSELSPSFSTERTDDLLQRGAEEQTAVDINGDSVLPYPRTDIQAGYELGQTELRTTLPYYVGLIAAEKAIFKPNLYMQARRLRANVYIDEKKFLDDTARQQDGGETDPDDDRSYHYVVSQRDSKPEVIGNSRIIKKRDESDLLPAERLFDLPPAPVGSVESSRYIARHPDKKIQNRVAQALIRAMAFHSIREQAPFVYAVVEEPLHRTFRMMGLPFQPVAEPKFIEEYNTVNVALRLDPLQIIPSLQEKDQTRSFKVAPFFEKAIDNHGLGQYDEEF